MSSQADLSHFKFTREHEWVTLEEGIALVGITDHAQEQLGDVVYLSLPEEGADVTQFGKLGEIESVKAVADLFVPLSGTVVEVNGALSDAPELVNQEPYGRGWLIKLELAQPAELENLMTAAEYEAYLRETAGHA
ncbi:MAG: glycine cleavage system protein GcvH [Chloroflexi bacterium]|nr:glycine cleavage system protein GcvH [Chloroflexota bacterium]